MSSKQHLHGATHGGSAGLETTKTVLDAFCRPPEDGAAFRLAFISAKLSEKGKPISNYPTEDEQQRLHDVLGMDTSFWSKMQQDSSSYFGAEDHAKPHSETHSMLHSHTTNLRLLIKVAETPPNASLAVDKGVPYAWAEFGVFTRWQPGGRTAVLVQCGRGTETIGALRHLLEPLTRLDNVKDPYMVYALILQRLVFEFDKSVWSWRDRVRDFEKDRLSQKAMQSIVTRIVSNEVPHGDHKNSSAPSEEHEPGKPTSVVFNMVPPEPDYQRMHEVARHIIHCTEMLATAINVIDNIIQEHDAFVNEHADLLKDAKIEISNTRKAFRKHKSFLQGFHLRSKALEDRLSNEVDLAFAAVTQHDSKVAVKIAEATQSDSASTKTISFLGLIFLPSTFVCSLFSTSFFSLQPTVQVDGTQGTQGPPSTVKSDNVPTYWMMSDRFWIYWVWAIPLTIVTIFVWSVWQNYSVKRHPKARSEAPRRLKLGAMFSPFKKIREQKMEALHEIEVGQKV
ncbi:hypothetical protein CAC42_3060 [Sphaceloma murrayae]|uniref:Uncharacterized protein n=1 Tax=Sphaceloma murrayae TaxID=2082308 RepID=A0A2K1QRH7_9PEZI|nr:hypothetical protein CAC42_3060 [Sphaceloma murrayae]